MPASRKPYSFVVAVSIAVAALITGIAGWQHGVVPWVEHRLAVATGHRVKLGALVPRWRRLEARDVVVFGTPPFEGAPLARIRRLDVKLGGSIFTPHATEVTADGAVVTYLAVGLGPSAVDNLRGRRRASATKPAPAGPGPIIFVRNSRLEAFLRLEGAKNVSARSEALELERKAEGTLAGRLEGITIDVPGWLTTKVPRLEVSRGGDRTWLSARDVGIAVPGGGGIIAAGGVEIGASGDRVSVSVTPAAGAASRALGSPEVALEVIGGALSGRARLTKLPIAALEPVLRPYGVGLRRGTADLALTFTAGTATPERSFPFRATLALRALEVHHARLDRLPWQNVSFNLEATATLHPGAGKLEVATATMNLLGLEAEVAGWVAAKPRFRGAWQIRPPKAGASACNAILAAWPEVLKERVRGLAVTGALGPRGQVEFDAGDWDALALELAVQPVCEVTSEPRVIAHLVAAPAGVAPPAQALSGVAVSSGLADFVALRKLPAHVVNAFLVAEDAGFRRHPGFDIEMIRRALAHNLSMGAAAKGASTITQQLAKNLFLSPERTLGRKLAEVVLAWRLEATIDKARILELYLNIVELGPGIRGVARAAHVFFGKSAEALSPLEAAHLASLLPNPTGFARRFRDGRVDEAWLFKLYDLLGRMRRSGVLSQSAWATARDARLALRKF